MRQAKLAAGGHEAALMHGLLPPAVLAAAENSWRQLQAELDPLKVSTNTRLRIQDIRNRYQHPRCISGSIS